jgi:hypothetical protein
VRCGRRGNRCVVVDAVDWCVVVDAVDWCVVVDAVNRCVVVDAVKQRAAQMKRDECSSGR